MSIVQSEAQGESVSSSDLLRIAELYPAIVLVEKRIVDAGEPEAIERFITMRSRPSLAWHHEEQIWHRSVTEFVEELAHRLNGSQS